jgi:hypothetical protein
MTFDSDDQFLVSTFESIVASLPVDVVEEAKLNGSYYDFHIKTKEYIIVPNAINFTFKYMHLIQQATPEYWEKVSRGWAKLISPTFHGPQDENAKNKIILEFDRIYSSDHYDIMPPILKKDEQFTYFKNLEDEATKIDATMMAGFKFSKLYEKGVEHIWNDDVTLYIFPRNDVSFYGMVHGKLTMLYPKWNSYCWAVELPKFITDTSTTPKIVKFKQFDIDDEQETIRLMLGAPSKDLFK